jgi:hypothetical protein
VTTLAVELSDLYSDVQGVIKSLANVTSEIRGIQTLVEGLVASTDSATLTTSDVRSSTMPEESVICGLA